MQDAELPEMYRRSYDPFVAMTAAAVVTERLIVATGICLVAQHDPIVLAKQVASLDHLSNGRLIFGIGYGWNEDEMRQHGVDPKKRRSIGRDKVNVMRTLWADEVSEYEGEFASLGPSWQFPKPVQKPYPPVLVGGGKAVISDVATWADGWMPIEGPMPVLKLLERVRQATTEAGRDPDAAPGPRLLRRADLREPRPLPAGRHRRGGAEARPRPRGRRPGRARPPPAPHRAVPDLVTPAGRGAHATRPGGRAGRGLPVTGTGSCPT